MKKKWITSILLCCVFAILLNGCANKPGTSLEAPPNSASDPTGTGSTEPGNPATDPVATGEGTAPTEGQPTDPAAPTEGQPKPTEGQPGPTGAPAPTETPKPTEAQPKPTEAKPQPNHKHSYQAQTVAPTCTEKGYTLLTCSCGDSYTDSYTNATGHSYDGGKVTKVATCAAEGVKTYTCTKCGNTKTEAIAKTAHSYVETVVAPSYSAGGYTQYTCSVCGYSYTDNETDQLVFDIDYWVEYAKDAAIEMGFIVFDDGKDGYWGGWDNPIPAYPDYADRGFIEEDIISRLTRYKNRGIEYIWIWVEPNQYTDKRAGYDLYIAYA